MTHTSYFRKALSFYIVLSSGFVFAEQLSPAPYKTMDNNYVNMASGYVSPTLADVSIGGSMGLTHTISAMAGSFAGVYEANWGPVDKFVGGLYNVLHTDRPGNNDLYVLRAFGPGGGADFEINGDGTYTALNDKRNKLVYISGVGYKFTTPDGTENQFYSNSSNGPYNSPFGGSLRSSLSKVVYPNGLTISISKGVTGMRMPIYSVNTNTGFQLKYVYEADTRPIPASVANANVQTHYGQPMNTNVATWHAMMPKYIKGINNAIDYCSASNATCTNLTKDWPTVQYEWPAGMPKAFWVGDSVFKVTDAMGRTTEYKHTAIDTYVEVQGEPVYGSPGLRFVPRISEIKDATANVAIMKFRYRNTGVLGSSGANDFTPRWSSTGSAVLSESYNDYMSQGYSISNKDVISGSLARIIHYGGGTFGNGYRGVNYYYFNPGFQVPEKIDTRVNTVTFDTDYENRIQSIYDKVSKTGKSYGYDTRGNVTSITLSPNSSSPITQTAVYPSTCTNPKTCNKATSITDGNGNTTYYQYHASSGAVSRVTSPPNEFGIAKVTRYAYTKKFATYKINNGNLSTSPDGIWLLTSEKTCINSATNGNSCAGNDELEVSYAYEPANLFMIEKSVKSAGTTLRTCYRYDIYGNKIGETQPKANLSTCA